MEEKDLYNNIIKEVARRTGISESGVKAVAELLDEGATVPFISRYRKERTGNLDEVAVRNIETALKGVRELEDRRIFITESIAGSGSLTPDLENRIRAASSMTELEDIYAPFKPKKRTRATAAKEKGLEPLAKMIMSGRASDVESMTYKYVGKNGVESTGDAIAGAKDIIAEWASENIRLRNITRHTYKRNASIVCTAAKGKETELEASQLRTYGDFSQAIRRIPSHQYLALRRAEREGLIKVKYSLDGKESELEDSLIRTFIPGHASKACAEIIEEAVRDSGKRLLRPSIENEISAELKEEADRVAIDIFSGNLRQLLLHSPLKGKRILALDPGFRTGCKVVALDQQGNLLEDAVIYPVPPKSDREGAARILRRMIKDHSLDTIALGNGTASHETESFLKASGLLPANSIYVVSENGASVYSASDLARQEFPDKDVTVRGAVSIGRRLIDPLAELVKIDPKSIGVGQYQHDVDQSKLKDSLDYTVMSCVNAVGIDVNTASEKLLSYVSGIGPALAANITAYRKENGDFRDRKELRKVARLGEKAFELCAGFLRVPGGKEPLDNTGIHPESYAIVKEISKRLGVKTSDLPANDGLLDKVDAESLAKEGIGGRETIRDIIVELRKPGRDPRTDDNSDAFRPEAETMDDLRLGMTLTGEVENITAFGAFVYIGPKERGLLHISKLGRRVSSVSDVLKLGQRINVTVIDIDKDRKRISLQLAKQ